MTEIEHIDQQIDDLRQRRQDLIKAGLKDQCVGKFYLITPTLDAPFYMYVTRCKGTDMQGLFVQVFNKDLLIIDRNHIYDYMANEDAEYKEISREKFCEILNGAWQRSTEALNKQ